MTTKKMIKFQDNVRIVRELSDFVLIKARNDIY